MSGQDNQITPETNWSYDGSMDASEWYSNTVSYEYPSIIGE